MTTKIGDLVMPHIFLVDAFRDEREMYAEYFSISGFDVSAFDSPEAALEAATTAAPDAIITRIRQNAGHIDGIELAARLKARPATRQVPTIVITTSILPSDREAATAAGSDVYLVLPITPDVLAKEVRQVLRLFSGSDS